MASIIKNETQIKALKDIEEGIETIKQLNSIIAADAKGAYFGAGGDKGKGSRIEVAPKEAKPFLAFCAKVKTRMVRDIYAKAEKHNISLDTEDKKTLGTTEK